VVVVAGGAVVVGAVVVVGRRVVVVRRSVVVGCSVVAGSDADVSVPSSSGGPARTPMAISRMRMPTTGVTILAHSGIEPNAPGGRGGSSPPGGGGGDGGGGTATPVPVPVVPVPPVVPFAAMTVACTRPAPAGGYQ
jgi:hypothetical protein